MKALLILVVLPALAEGGTPVQKVIGMLEGMTAKAKKEKHEEQVQFAAYKQFCSGTTSEKSATIKDTTAKVEMLKADIGAAEADAERLGQEARVMEADIMTWSGDLKAAAKVREIEHNDYVAVHTDYTESLDALADAIQVLKAQNKDTKQVAAMLQKVTSSARVPKTTKHNIEAFLSEPDLDGPPQANAYEFQSSGVIDMLEKLKDKFYEERATLEKEEVNARNAYQLLRQDLQASTKNAEDSINAKNLAKAKSLQTVAESKGELQDAEAAVKADTAFLSELEATCKMKAKDYESRQQLRADEIAALDKAVEILAGSGATAKASAGLLQVGGSKQHTSLAQLRRSSQVEMQPNQLRVAAYLHHEAERTGSVVLAAVSAHAREDPFAKVKKMIRELIMRLQTEANNEADHKAWCDKELATNEQTRKEKSLQVDNLKSEIEELNAAIGKLGEELSELSKAVANIDTSLAEKTALRTSEKEKNDATVKDAQDAQTAVQQAIQVLREFYAKAGSATAMLQGGRQEPEVFDTAYQGQQQGGAGVISMLEVIQSDFARLESETSAAESSAAKEQQEFLDDAAVDKAAKNKDIEHKSLQKQSKEQSVSEKKADLDTTGGELSAALAEFEKLKPSCLDAGESIADRAQRRKEEIEALQEALKILNGEDIAAIQK